MSDCCGGNGGCSSSCKCGDDCSRCGMSSETLIVGIAPVNMHHEGSEMGSAAENDGCKCGPNCSCCRDSCKCGK